ncbi:MAG TPA: hypothetical protein PK245_03955, partial [Clostridia bacterium]|nr:hypothetical protein [Clostridia bacterium]
MDIKRIAILGATGSIGRQALEVIRGAKELSAVALACRFDAAGLAEAARELYVENLYIADKSHISNLGKYFKLHDSMTKLLKSVDFDVALFAATVDKDNFGDMLAAAKYTLESGKTAALASKELIVAAG